MSDFMMPCPHCGKTAHPREDQLHQIVTCLECGKTFQAEPPAEKTDSILAACPKCEKIVSIPVEKDNTEMCCPFCGETARFSELLIRSCPFCKESIEAAENVCTFCKKELPPITADPLPEKKAEPAAAPAKERSEEEKEAAKAAVLGEKVSDSDDGGFEAFEKPEEEPEVIVAPLKKIPIPWRTMNFIIIASGVLALIVAVEIVITVVLFYSGEKEKEEVVRENENKQKVLTDQERKAKASRSKLEKEIQAKIRADEQKEIDIQNARLLAEAEKLPAVSLVYPENLVKPAPEETPMEGEAAPETKEGENVPETQPAEKESEPVPLPEIPDDKNPFAFFLTALKENPKVDETTKIRAMSLLGKRFREILDAVREERKFERVPYVEAVAKMFDNAGYELSDVTRAADEVRQFQQDEKARALEEKKAEEDRKKAEIEARKQQKKEAKVKFKSQLETLADLYKDLKDAESELNFVRLQPSAAQREFTDVFFSTASRQDGSAAPVEDYLKKLSEVTDVTCTDEKAKELLEERYSAVDAEIQKNLPLAPVIEETKKKIAVDFPVITRGMKVSISYKEGKNEYEFTDAFIETDEKSVTIGAKTFLWNTVTEKSRKIFHARTRADAMRSVMDEAIKNHAEKQNILRGQRRETERVKLFSKGVVVYEDQPVSIAGLCKKFYPVAGELVRIRVEIRKILEDMCPFYKNPSNEYETAASEGLNQEYGLFDKSNISKALKAYKKAAKELVWAQVRLGDIYSTPDNPDLEQNKEEALRYYRRAAKKKNDYARDRVKELSDSPKRNKKGKK